MECILGIDVGTSNVKAVLFDGNGTEVQVASRESETINDGGNWEEQDMLLVWDKVKSCIKELIDSGAVKSEEIVSALCANSGIRLRGRSVDGRSTAYKIS